MDKSIDLGALQHEVIAAEAYAKKCSTALRAAYVKADRAIEVRDSAKMKLEDALKAIDATKRTMLEAARTIASS
jgi:hypothetical protein